MCIALRSHLLSSACFISMLSIFAIVFAQADEQSVSFILGKPCSSNFQCWRSEPVDDSGMPLSITGGLSKRLEIGGSMVRGG
uniref:Secreted protein n=1 Tax=Ascaris lumbricoides TaxID=6252 RepID=A0A0M3IJS2_ASCLU